MLPNTGHVVHALATGGGCIGNNFQLPSLAHPRMVFSSLKTYRNAIYPQGMGTKNGLGGRLPQYISTVRITAYRLDIS